MAPSASLGGSEVSGAQGCVGTSDVNVEGGKKEVSV